MLETHREETLRIGKVFNALTSGLASPSEWLIEQLGGKASKTGIKVTMESSLGLAPVTYAINRISGHVSQMPVDICEEQPDGSEVKLRNNTWRLLNEAPNSIMTAFQFREVMMVHALMAGNARAYIQRNQNGTPVQLIPVMPYNCQTILVDGEKWHIITRESGQAQDIMARNDSIVDGNYFKVPNRDMLHVMGTSYNGIWGLHTIDIARDVFGLTQAGQDGAATTIANSGRPGIMLEAPPGMFRTPSDAKEWLDAFNAKHEGLDNTGRAGLLTDGIKANTLPISASDAQFLEQRNFQREEVALLFGLESILGDNSGQTYRSITERNVAYVTNCLQRWMTKWVQEIDTKLIANPRQSSRFDPGALLEGDPNSLAQYTNLLSQQGIATVNELRAFHNLDPVDDGDKLPSEVALEIAEATKPRDEEDDTSEPTTDSSEED